MAIHRGHPAGCLDKLKKSAIELSVTWGRRSSNVRRSLGAIIREGSEHWADRDAMADPRSSKSSEASSATICTSWDLGFKLVRLRGNENGLALTRPDANARLGAPYITTKQSVLSGRWLSRLILCFCCFDI